ncbi:MAG: guanylate kinase, partial [Flavobacteriaceae bacterium]|nr:guanylate kinase [Flavobacteriaceae bacterium]
LKSRAKDPDRLIKIRLDKAKQELQKDKDFDYILINDDLNLAKENAYQIVEQFLNNS